MGRRDRGTVVRYQDKEKEIIPFSKEARQEIGGGPTQPPTENLSRALSEARGRQLMFHLLLKGLMCGAIPPFGIRLRGVLFI